MRERPSGNRVVGRGLRAVCLTGVVSVSGCILFSPPPEPVTVRLVNNSGFVVDANVYVRAAVVDAGTLFGGAIYTAWATGRPFPTLRPGQSVEFVLSCEQIETIGVAEPVFSDLLTFTGGRSPDRIVLTRPADFACGATIVFTYSADPNVDLYQVVSSVE